jgi:hypothetical protein
MATFPRLEPSAMPVEMKCVTASANFVFLSHWSIWYAFGKVIIKQTVSVAEESVRCGHGHVLGWREGRTAVKQTDGWTHCGTERIGMEAQLHQFMASALDAGELSASRPAALPPGKEPPVSIVLEAGRAPGRSGSGGEEKNLWSAGNRTPVLQFLV